MIIFWFKHRGESNKVAAILENDMHNAWRILSDTVACSDISNAMLNWSPIGSTPINAEAGLIAYFNITGDNSLSLYDPPLT